MNRLQFTTPLSTGKKSETRAGEQLQLFVTMSTGKKVMYQLLQFDHLTGGFKIIIIKLKGSQVFPVNDQDTPPHGTQDLLHRINILTKQQAATVYMLVDSDGQDNLSRRRPGALAL